MGYIYIYPISPLFHFCWCFFQNFKNKIFIFKYFPKNHSEMTSTHPFYPILIPNTSYVKFVFKKLGKVKNFQVWVA